MAERYRRRPHRALVRVSVAATASVVLAVVAGVSTAGAQQDDAPSVVECITAPGEPELYGPTDINSQSANQGLSAAFNAEGTLSVFRWPSPSYYDQVRYRAWSRDEPRLGVAPTDGAFLGLRVSGPSVEATTTWLRDWATTQTHSDGFSDEVITTHRNDELGLTVEVRDVVAHGADVLGRNVTVARDEDSPVEAADLLAYENLSLVVTKIPKLPVQDWCFESENTDSARFDTDIDAVVHTKSGTDESTGEPVSAAVAMGFDTTSNGVQIGWDPLEPVPDDMAADTAAGALEDAVDGDLAGNSGVEGHTTAVLSARLHLEPVEESEARSTTTLWFTAGEDPDDAAELLEQARAVTYAELADNKQAWLEDLLADAPMPEIPESDPAHDEVLAVARRALVTLVTDVDRDSRAIVASIATQSPYGEDWPRDGAFFDYVLDLIGLHDWVDDHHDFYIDTQQSADDPDPVMTELGVPPGNWAMNYYADGVVGGPIPWEIDETGYSLWNFWEHFRATEDSERLAATYPTVKAAADFLKGCTDEANGLQCVAYEDDNFDQRQTIVGASTVWLGLDSATKIAEALGEDADAARWSARRDELGEAIDSELWTGQSYGEGSAPLIWPVCYRSADDPGRMSTHEEATWENVSPTFDEPAAGEKVRGQYEAKALLALAKHWREDPERLGWVREGLRWLAEHHAEAGTAVMGEAWQVRNGEVISVVSQPHAWEQVLFYLASLEAWPPAEVADAPLGCDGVLAALRERSSHEQSAAVSGGPAAGPAGATAEDSDDWWLWAGIAALVLAAVGGAAFAYARRPSTTDDVGAEDHERC